MTNPIQENLDRISALRLQCLNHPMCLRLEESPDNTVCVTFPEGDFGGIGAVQTRQKTKAASFELILEKLESYWLGSFPQPIETAPWPKKESEL